MHAMSMQSMSMQPINVNAGIVDVNAANVNAVIVNVNAANVSV